MNIRTAFPHNVADALGSIGMIVAGTLIILLDWRIIDPVVTLIAGYILWLAFSEIGGTIRSSCWAPPPGSMRRRWSRSSAGSRAWSVSIDEQQNALEAHIVVPDGTAAEAASVKQRIKAVARERFAIAHATLETESASAACHGNDATVIGHPVDTGHAQQAY